MNYFLSKVAWMMVNDKKKEESLSSESSESSEASEHEGYHTDEEDGSQSSTHDDNDENYDHLFDDTWYQEIQQKRQDEQFEKQRQQIQLQKRIIEILQKFPQNSPDLIAHFCKLNHKEVLDTLPPMLQLQYLDEILKNYSIEDKHQLLQLHIALLCKYDPFRVLPTLQNHSYPLDDALKLTRQYKIMDATAYLLERTGAIELALNELFELIEDILRTFIKDRLGVPVVQKSTKNDQIIVPFRIEPRDVNEFKAVFDKYIQEILMMLIRNKKYDHAELEWYHLLNKVLELHKWLKRVHDSAPQKRNFVRMLNHLDDSICRIIEQIASHSQMDFFIDQFYSTYSTLSLGKLKFTFSNLLRSFVQIINILHLAKDQMVFTQIMVGDVLDIIYKKGIRVVPLCSACDLLCHMIPDGHKELQDCILFYCGHIFHKSCMKQLRQKVRLCPLCVSDISYLFDALAQNNKEKRERLIHDKFVIPVPPEAKIKPQKQAIEIASYTPTKKDRLLAKLQAFDNRRDQKKIKF